MKILIAVPTFETIFPDTYQSIWDMEKENHECIFRFARGYDCATARNHIAQMAIDLKTDYVLMVDNDVTVPKNALINMLEDPKDVCLGYYAHRDSDNVFRGRVSVCKLIDANGKLYFNYPLDSEYTDKEMQGLKESQQYKIQIHGGGMGCAFIKTDIFKHLKYPWYDWVNYKDEHRGMLSEDLYFCEQCKAAKIPIFTDSRVGCGHMLRHIQQVL